MEAVFARDVFARMKHSLNIPIAMLWRGGHRSSAVRVAVASCSAAAAMFAALAPSAQAVDPNVYRAGQQIDFLDPDEQVSHSCTSAFVATVDSGGGPRTVGLSAGHCAPSGWNAWRLEPSHGEVPGGGPIRVLAGGVSQSHGDSKGPVDVLAFSMQGPVAQEIERGTRIPLKINGFLRTRDQRPGLRVCFTGRTSGVDRCGSVIERPLEHSPKAVCTDMRSAQGDSGGPVYTQGGLARTGPKAVGIVSFHRRINGAMCYFPIEDSLDRLGARWYSR